MCLDPPEILEQYIGICRYDIWIICLHKFEFNTCSLLNIFTYCTIEKDPSIAQLVARRTVVDISIYFDRLFQDAMKYNSMMSYLNFHLIVRWILIIVSLHRHWKNSSIMDCSLLFSSVGVPKAKVDHYFLPHWCRVWAIHNNDHHGRSYSNMFPKELRN